MDRARCEFYADLIAENSKDQRKWFCIAKSLLCEPSEESFPKYIFTADLVNSFGLSSCKKIGDINKCLDDLSPLTASDTGERDCAV